MAFPQSDPYGGAPQGGWGGPPGYPPYGYAVDHPQGTTVLVLGILSIVMCQVCGPFAWSIGRKTLAEIDAQPGRYSNRGLVQAGYICGIVGSILLALSVVGGLVYLIAVIAFIGSSA